MSKLGSDRCGAFAHSGETKAICLDFLAADAEALAVVGDDKHNRVTALLKYQLYAACRGMFVGVV